MLEIVKRTFKAKSYPKDSEERKKLNESPLTSEYMPSYKYMVISTGKDLIERSFRTKAEAEEYKQEKIKTC